MSKEVSQTFGGIGDAIGGVFKGVGAVVDGAVKGVGTLVKQIYDSDIGKAIIIAGAVYFGGAALAGGFGTMGTSASFLSGMGAGVSSAATSLQAAWGLATSGTAGSLGQAASTIGNSWGTAFGAGAQLGAPVVETAAALSSAAQAPMPAQIPSAPSLAPAAAAPPPVATAGMPAGSPITSTAAGSYTPVAQTAAGAPAATQPWYAQAMDYITPKSELAQFGLINAATSVGGNVIAAIGQQQAAEDERAYQEKQLQAARDLRNANVGAELFAPGQYAAAPGPAPMPAGLARRYMPQYATA